MKNIILLIVFFFAVYSQADSQWVNLNLGNGFDIFDFSFPNAQTGYICGYGGSFKKTTSGGTNWTNMSFPSTQFNLNAVHFFNANTGLLASDNDTIYRTINGTQNWSDKIFIGFHVYDFQFFDSINGYASGTNRIAKTTNNGLNWTVSTIQSNGQIYFINQNTGWTISGNATSGSNILKTTDAGITWQIQYATTNFKMIYDVFFVNENTGYASGYRHGIYKTTDGGLNWFSQSEQTGANGLYSIYFINANSGWTVGDFYSTTNTNTYYTTNGGTNWINTNGVVSGRLNRVKINNSPVGYIAGQNQAMFRTTNAGGLTSVKINPGVTPSDFSLSQNYPNPFNPVTKISFNVAKTGFVSLIVYDALGRQVHTLVNENLNSGSYNVSLDAAQFTSGVYFYRMNSAGFSDTKRFVLLK